jgi:hypothetical protein
VPAQLLVKTFAGTPQSLANFAISRLTVGGTPDERPSIERKHMGRDDKIEKSEEVVSAGGANFDDGREKVIAPGGGSIDVPAGGGSLDGDDDEVVSSGGGN